MKGRRFFLFFIFSLSSFCTSLFGNSFLLDVTDVRKVMDELFEYHIDKKEISTLILERSLKVYIDQFDVRKSYVQANEVDPFLHPKKAFLQVMLKDYKAESFSTYFALNERLQASIYRAREWRQEWERNPRALVEDAQKLKIGELVEEKEFPATLDGLKNNHYREFLKLIRYHVEDLDKEKLEGKEARIVALCEKQLSLSENPYLGRNDEGYGISVKEQQHQVILRTLKALSNSLDAHTAYYSPEEAHAMKVQLEKGMCGIGVVLHEDIHGVKVADVIKGGPAESQGILHVGDHIIEVDGLAIKDCSFHKVLEVLRGEEGTKTILGVIRDQPQSAEEFVRVEITRAKMTIDDKRVDISYEPFGDGVIGKITLYSFYEGEDGISSEKDLRKAIEYLQKQGPLYGLVLDMRNNSGGFLSQAVRVSGLFISAGVVVIAKYSDDSMKFYRAVDGRKLYDGPLVVLVSKGSASATEIVAQTLQDYGVAVVVGDSQTYGKGTIQHQTVTSDKTQSFFKVTIGRYYTVSGKSTQIDGVKADIVVPTEYHGEKIGEGFLDFPLASDKIEPAFDDSLVDLDVYARKWFTKYYIPSIQKKVQSWSGYTHYLRKNSEKRLVENKNFQSFLRKANREKVEEKSQFGGNDLQMEESVNIVKDMIFLKTCVPNRS